MSFRRHLTRRVSTDESVRFYAGLTMLLLFSFTVAFLASLHAYTMVFEREHPSVVHTPDPFPVSVYPAERRIVESPTIERYLYDNVAVAERSRLRHVSGWWQKTVAFLTQSRAWQQMASPATRVLVIWSGERKEQVVSLFGDVLRWSPAERERFASVLLERNVPLTEGVFFPGKYVVPYDATPEMVADTVHNRFVEEITARYPEAVAQQVSLQQALTIASLLEREAYDFEDMRVISGVIWNRLFADMNLQLDATLQYAKGSRPYGAWWPTVRPADKYLESPFNTYEHAGLPPMPIANPSVEAVLAALNPKQTECYYYFHDTQGQFYCSATYKEHVAQLRSVFGQGK